MAAFQKANESDFQPKTAPWPQSWLPRIWFPAGSNKRRVRVRQADGINQQHYSVHLLQRQVTAELRCKTWIPLYLT